MSVPPARVLLVDDDPVGRLFLAEALAQLPVTVDSAADCTAARAIAAGHAHALAVIDLRLPDGDGCTLLAQLRHHGCTCVAIALTADPTRSLDTELRGAGFVAVAHKPLPAAAFRALVSRWLPAANGDPPDSAPLAMAGLGDGRVANAQRAASPAHVAASIAAAGVENTPPRWDDRLALSAAGGRQDIVIALRALLRSDLAAQREQVLGAVSGADFPSARAVLHRMQAASGFCGAVQLGHAVAVLDSALAGGHLPTAALREFEQACAEIQNEGTTAH